MKRSSQIAFFFCLLTTIFFSFSFLFFRAYIKSQKAGFRKELGALNASVFKTLEIEQSQLYKNGKGLEWEDGNNELVIDGKYHDVISVSAVGTRALIKFVSDEKESALFDNFFSKQKEGRDVVISFLKMFCGINNGFALTIENKPELLPDNLSFRSVFFQLDDFYSLLIKPPCLI